MVRRRGPVVFGGVETDRIGAFDHDLGAAQRPVGLDFELCHSAFNGAQIAAGIFRGGSQAGPRRVDIGDAGYF